MQIPFLHRPHRNGKPWVKTTHLSLSLPSLPAEFDGYTLAQISDLHLGSWITPEKLAQAVALVNQEHPDLIAITGDFLTWAVTPHLETLTSNLAALTPRDATVAVLGNHDHWGNTTLLIETLRSTGILVLNNEVHTLRRGSAALHIAGIDSYLREKDCLECVLQQIQDTHPAILLAHEPDFADVSAASGRFMLQISGHSHGGQIVLPLIGPPFLPRYARKYTTGLHRVGEMYQYTNRGLGRVHFPIRFNCPPEITVFTLHK
jgi:uncharacterized protein